MAFFVATFNFNNSTLTWKDIVKSLETKLIINNDENVKVIVKDLDLNPKTFYTIKQAKEKIFKHIEFFITE